MKWSFPSNNGGDVNGIGNSGVETFQGAPLKSLAREICQNSLDASNSDKPVEVEFMPFELDKTSFLDSATLMDAFKRSLEFWDIKKAKDCPRLRVGGTIGSYMVCYCFNQFSQVKCVI